MPFFRACFRENICFKSYDSVVDSLLVIKYLSINYEEKIYERMARICLKSSRWLFFSHIDHINSGNKVGNCAEMKDRSAVFIFILIKKAGYTAT